MSIQNNTADSGRANTVIINNRQSVLLTGVSEVVSFDENTVILSCGNDMITIDGSGLNITKLSLETGEVDISGVFEGLFYSQAKQPKNGFFSRFK